MYMSVVMGLQGLCCACLCCAFSSPVLDPLVEILHLEGAQSVLHLLRIPVVTYIRGCSPPSTSSAGRN